MPEENAAKPRDSAGNAAFAISRIDRSRMIANPLLNRCVAEKTP
jgi:hypothetical protein